MSDFYDLLTEKMKVPALWSSPQSSANGEYKVMFLGANNTHPRLYVVGNGNAGRAVLDSKDIVPGPSAADEKAIKDFITDVVSNYSTKRLAAAIVVLGG